MSFSTGLIIAGVIGGIILLVTIKDVLKQS